MLLQVCVHPPLLVLHSSMSLCKRQKNRCQYTLAGHASHTSTTGIIFFQNVSIMTRTVETTISISTVMVTPSIVELTFINICSKQLIINLQKLCYS